MKILGFYITRIDYKTLYERERAGVENLFNDYHDLKLNSKPARDERGRFISKDKQRQDAMTKTIRDQVNTLGCSYDQLKQACKGCKK